jgi:hydroxypyruvate isomerase
LLKIASALPYSLQLCQYLPVNASEQSLGHALKGKINHSVCRWCYDKIAFEDLCKPERMGLQSENLTGPEEWPILKNMGLLLLCPGGW